jgi:hypothetical protein
MSENTFYDLIKRYAIENENGLKDKSKKPKNPYRKLEEDYVIIIIEKAQNNRLKNIPKHLKRSENPLQNFSMDFTRKRLGNGEIGHFEDDNS